MVEEIKGEKDMRYRRQQLKKIGSKKTMSRTKEVSNLQELKIKGIKENMVGEDRNREEHFPILVSVQFLTSSLRNYRPPVIFN